MKSKYHWDESDLVITRSVEKGDKPSHDNQLEEVTMSVEVAILQVHKGEHIS